MLSVFDPAGRKAPNSFGGYDSNEKGIIQYPKRATDITQKGSSLKTQSYQTFAKAQVQDAFSSRILDPVSRHYRLFVQDPDRSKQTNEKMEVGDVTDGELYKEPKAMSCGMSKIEYSETKNLDHALKKPIDPIHWDPSLFDTYYEKYYLRNNLVEDPYRPFLSSLAEATTPPHYFTEYKESFSGNPTKSVSSSGRIIGLSRPTDITETCDWRRNRTHKLRDVVYTHETDPVDSHLDYNDPKRYNPWPRLKISYDQMLEGNYRPRPSSGVEYNVTTLLPALSHNSKSWIV